MLPPSSVLKRLEDAVRLHKLSAVFQLQPGYITPTTLISILKMEAAIQSEILVSTTKATYCHNPKDHNVSFSAFMEPFLLKLNTIYIAKDILPLCPYCHSTPPTSTKITLLAFPDPFKTVASYAIISPYNTYSCTPPSTT
jgi:hypothetical protein